MNTLFKALLALLAILVVAAVAVTVFARKSGATVGEETTSYVEETTVPVEESATVEDTSESTPERTTVKEEISKLDISYEATTVFETKQLKRKFKGQDDRFKIYKKIFEEKFNMFLEKEDITKEEQAELQTEFASLLNYIDSLT